MLVYLGFPKKHLEKDSINCQQVTTANANLITCQAQELYNDARVVEYTQKKKGSRGMILW